MFAFLRSGLLMNFVSTYMRSRYALSIVTCAVLSLAHVSPGWCDQPRVDCTALSADIVGESGLLRDLKIGYSSLAQEQATCLAEIEHLNRTKVLAAEQRTRRLNLETEVTRLSDELGRLQGDIADKENLIKVLQSDWTLNNCGGVAAKPPSSKKPRSTTVGRNDVV